MTGRHSRPHHSPVAMAAAANPFTSTPSKPSPFHQLSALPDYLNPFDEPILPPHESSPDNLFSPSSPFSPSYPSNSLHPFLESSPIHSPDFGSRSSVSDDNNMSLEMMTLSEEEVDSYLIFLHENVPIARLPPLHGIVECIPSLHGSLPECYKATSLPSA